MARTSDRAEAARGLRGFTLIEILIAMAITAIVITSLVMIFVSQQKSYTQQSEIARAQANARGALFAMSRDIRMAGFSGVPLGFDQLSIQGLAYPIVTPNISDASVDQTTIEIYGNFSRRTTGLLSGGTAAPNPIFSGDTGLKVSDHSIFQGVGVNKPLWVMVGNNDRVVELHQIETVDADGTITLKSGESFFHDFEVDNAIVVPIYRRKFWVGGDHTLWMRNCDTAVLADGCPSGSDVRLSTGIDGIEFSYDEINALGDAVTTERTKACNPCRIRGVNIKLRTHTQNTYDPNKVINLESGTSVKVRNIGFETTSCVISGCSAP